MNVVKTGFFALLVLAICAGTALAKTITVDINSSSDYSRYFYEPELQQDANGDYQANFVDTFIFTLTESGSLSFQLSEQDSHSMFGNEYVDITSVAFANGSAPSDVTPWEKLNPAFNPNDNKVATFTWDWLAAGTYNLVVEGLAFSDGGFPATYYRMKDVTFQKGPNPNPNPVPEPATMMLLGAGLLGLAGTSRMQKRK